MEHNDRWLQNNCWLIGISVDRFPSDNIDAARSVLEFALNRTQGQIVILVADRIQRHNRLAFRLASRSSLREDNQRNDRVATWARAQGEKHFRLFKSLLDGWPNASERVRVRVIRWDDPPGDMEMERRSTIASLCRGMVNDSGDDRPKTNKAQQMLLNMANRCILTRRPSCSPESLDKRIPFCCDYLIEELPTLMAGMRLSPETENVISTIHHSVVVHPVINPVASAESIRHLEPLIQLLKSQLAPESEFAKDAANCQRFDLHVRLTGMDDCVLIPWHSIVIVDDFPT